MVEYGVASGNIKILDPKNNVVDFSSLFSNIKSAIKILDPNNNVLDLSSLFNNIKGSIKILDPNGNEVDLNSLFNSIKSIKILGPNNSVVDLNSLFNNIKVAVGNIKILDPNNNVVDLNSLFNSIKSIKILGPNNNVVDLNSLFNNIKVASGNIKILDPNNNVVDLSSLFSNIKVAVGNIKILDPKNNVVDLNSLFNSIKSAISYSALNYSRTILISSGYGRALDIYANGVCIANLAGRVEFAGTKINTSWLPLPAIVELDGNIAIRAGARFCPILNVEDSTTFSYPAYINTEFEVLKVDFGTAVRWVSFVAGAWNAGGTTIHIRVYSSNDGTTYTKIYESAAINSTSEVILMQLLNNVNSRYLKFTLVTTGNSASTNYCTIRKIIAVI